MQMNIAIPVTFFREGKVFIAHSPVLDVSTSADTFEKAQKRFQEAVEIFFEELTEKGTMDEVLTGLGWQKIDRQWNPPLQISQSITNVTIPFAH